jgi:hypothetical protein
MYYAARGWTFAGQRGTVISLAVNDCACVQVVALIRPILDENKKEGSKGSVV